MVIKSTVLALFHQTNFENYSVKFIICTFPVKNEHRAGTKEGEEESSGGAFSQENLEQMGQEIGTKVGEQMMQVGKEEFQTGLHKVEDKIDRNTDKWIDDMSNRIQSGK